MLRSSDISMMRVARNTWYMAILIATGDGHREGLPTKSRWMDGAWWWVGYMRATGWLRTPYIAGKGGGRRGGKEARPQCTRTP